MKTIVLVLRSGKDFTFKDVNLLTSNILKRWIEGKPRIILIWDKCSEAYSMGDIEVIPMTNNYPGTWSRMQLYSPEMDKYRPFLYVDLDTVIISSLEFVFDLVQLDEFITLEDFWQPEQLATGLVWFPKESEKVKKVWEAWQKSDKSFGFRMDYFLRKVVEADRFWQELTNKIVDFKPKYNGVLQDIPKGGIVCFHGKPRIFEAKEQWVKDYVNQT
jgi:hypothetical protein